jgi:carbonic anhydrase
MIDELLRGNRRFVEQTFKKERGFFLDLVSAQAPAVLWIGCSDSRVPANIVTDTRPGDIFVHRNVANIVARNDWNLSAVLEYSISSLRIPQIVVCGHYGCGGIAALDAGDSADKYVPIWLINAQKAKERVEERIAEEGLDLSVEDRRRRIVEENVRLQLEHLQEYPFVRKAMREQGLSLHGWVYDMESGEISVLEEARA